jgi:hypothetical protein
MEGGYVRTSMEENKSTDEPPEPGIFGVDSRTVLAG